MTKTKVKERLEGKDAAVMISEDDDNNSFFHKSEGQHETTENTRKIKQQKTKHTFLRHATGKVQQPRTTKRFPIKKMEKIRIQGEQLSVRQTSTTEDHTKISHIEDRKETAQGQDHLTSNVPQPKTKDRLRREKIEKKQHKAKYLTGKVPLLKTRKRFRREKMEKKQHKEEYLTGKVPKLKTRERLRTEKIENKKDKAKYLTGNVPQPNTTEIYPAEKMENKQHKVNYLTWKIRRPHNENERKHNTKIYS